MDKYEGLNKYRLNGQIFKAENAKEIVKSIENDPGISLPRLCYECGVSEEYAVLVMRAHGLACTGTDIGFKDIQELTSFRIWRNQKVEQVIGVVVDEIALVMEYCRNRPWVDSVRLTLESNK